MRSQDTERLIYCSGRDWSGDGSKASSPCRFGRSQVTTAKRFKCPYCTAGQSPEGIYADANGVKKMIPKNALTVDPGDDEPHDVSPGTPEVALPKVEVALPKVEVAPPGVEEKVEKSVKKAKTKRRRPRF